MTVTLTFYLKRPKKSE